MKLPQDIKLLLSRKFKSNPCPPLHRLHDAFSVTSRKADRHGALDGWLVLATSTFLTANVPSAVAHLYEFVSRKDPKESGSLLSAEQRTARASLMRDAALKSTIFVGVPRTILTLEALNTVLESDVKASLRTKSYAEATPENIETIKDRGRKLWKNIYTPHDVKLAEKLGGYHPDFISFIIQSYGSVLTPWYPGDPAYVRNGGLTRALSSVVGTACLHAEGGVGPQLTSHVFGLLKANVDEYEGHPTSPGDRWLSSDEGTEWVIRTTDQLYGVARGEPTKEDPEPKTPQAN